MSKEQIVVRSGQESSGAVARGASWSAEVQALRAVAVLLVVFFHLWPEVVPGGYVGVDVFFVISGFLITGHLLRDLAAGTFRISRFYVRRARRLLPASLLVLGVTMVGVLLLQSSLVWVQNAQQVVASATYVQNWVLAAQHVDYLNPELSPTAVQHFWSLSVEEQFYLIWPVTLLIATGGGLGWTRRHRGQGQAGTEARTPTRLQRPAVVISLMALLFALSLGYAIQVTSQHVEGAYFFSTARVWQFAAGGLLAAVTLAWRARSQAPAPEPSVEGTARAGFGGPRSGLLRAAASWAGFAVIVVVGFRFTAETSVPGWPALLPVAGTVAVIAAGHVDSLWSPAFLVRLRPVQWTGRVSYSLYLWHWPLIVLAPDALGRESLRTRDTVALLGLSLVLAGLTKWLVEDRFLTKPLVAGESVPARGDRARLKVRPSPGMAAILAGVVIVTGTAGATWATVAEKGETAQHLADRAIAARTPCFGAEAALHPDRCSFVETASVRPFGKVVTPAPANAATEIQRSEVWRDCFHGGGSVCRFGPEDADVQVVLFGDSHALQWFPAVQEVAVAKRWRITTYMRAACPPNPAPMRSKAPARDEACRRWAERSLAAIAATPDVDAVIVTAFNSKKWQSTGSLSTYDAGVAGYRDSWQRLLDGGVKSVVAIRDTPRPTVGALECVALSDQGGADCSRSRKAATRRSDSWSKRPDPLESAVRAVDRPEVGLVDLTDAFCGPRSCPAVIGNVLVHVDDNHISPTYARTLAPELERRLRPYLAPATAD